MTQVVFLITIRYTDFTDFSVDNSEFLQGHVPPKFLRKHVLEVQRNGVSSRQGRPLKDFTFFHSGCFKCAICGTKLTLKTYYNNQHRQEDKEVYCNSHVPKIGPGHLDGSSVGIRSALNVPKSTNLYNEQIRGPSRVSNDSEGLHVRTHINGSNHQPHSPTYGGYSPNNYSYHQETSPSYQYGRFDASALHIAHALKQTELQKSYKVHREKPIDCYLDRDEQKKLEMRHRKEEDDLFRKFQRQREEEEKRIRTKLGEVTTEDEWEKELERLTSKFEREMQIKRKREEQNTLSIRHQQEKDDLEKNMTLRRDKKKESLTRKMLEHERAATAALVEKQSHEMLELINEKRSEYMQAESLYIDHNEAYTEEVQPYPSHAPAPAPPALSKFQVYNDPVEFANVDQIAISVAQEDQKSFTDLVRQLVGRCGSDVEKARTIFRWITVKNLNTMSFDENLRGDTPMGLLRGIKNGTESYHVLFKRLCSYAGLHCVVIKGYSKSAGYQPGVIFEDNRFRNSWNAVYVAGAWRFVQCNWGARHLVNAKEAPKAGAATVKIAMPSHMQATLIFHYNLKFYDSEGDTFEGVSLKRFVMQSVVGNMVAFRVHAPCSGAFLLDIFANAVTPKEYLTGEPMKFKSVCKFKICCENLQTVMVPLPDCASGEWGPTKATRLFGLVPITHQDSLVYAGRELEIQFRMSRQLTDFMATLHKNGVEEKRLSKFVSHSVAEDIVTFNISFPEEGQYGLDIYTREMASTLDLTGEKHLLTHCCKYLINSSKRN
ncbi:unnamed protein product [Diabrotica balteata]|uniref:Transglutaminase-like domain-containing protein n=1 Tax=Diabrotica balteata TaxID=107213 RepID=A0A9N9T2B3_DIABA|nr:unnamed protein product [Diabrotica balteata]